MLSFSRFGRLIATLGIIFMISIIPAANAEPTIRDKCRETAYRMDHQKQCAPYYSPGPFVPSRPSDGNNGGLIGLIRKIIGGFL